MLLVVILVVILMMILVATLVEILVVILMVVPIVTLTVVVILVLFVLVVIRYNYNLLPHFRKHNLEVVFFGSLGPAGGHHLFGRVELCRFVFFRALETKTK